MKLMYPYDGIEVGYYYYCRPGWDKPVKVLIEEYSGKLYVRFKQRLMPTKLLDGPVDAFFKKV